MILGDMSAIVFVDLGVAAGLCSMDIPADVYDYTRGA